MAANPRDVECRHDSGFVGRCSLSIVWLAALSADIFDGIKKAGAARVIVLNTSIRKNLPHESAIAACAYPHAYHFIYVSAGEGFQCGVDVSSEQERGGHADEIETLMMVAVDEGVERLALAKSTPMQTASAQFNRTNQTIRRMVLTVIRTWQRGKGRQFLASPTVVPLSKF